MPAVLARKVGMTQIFVEGITRPVTVVHVPTNMVVRAKTETQSAIIGAQLRKHVNHPQKKELEQLGITATLTHREGFDNVKKAVGATISAADFMAGQKVTVSGITKGKGFAGTIKRHGFTRGPETHGSDNVRRPGSIGSQQPQRVIKGRRMAGHLGVERRTLQHVEVVEVMAEEQLLLLAGSIPGAKAAILEIESE